MFDDLEPIIRLLKKKNRHFNLIIQEKIWDDQTICLLSDNFEQIIWHFARSSAMSNGPMTLVNTVLDDSGQIKLSVEQIDTSKIFF